MSIVIPTLSRHVGLARAVQSIEEQELPEDLDVEVIIVDNSAAADARDLFSGQRFERLRLVYLSEPQPGVANGRNAGVAASKSEWIVFLDDDQVAQKDWLSALYDMVISSGADAVFGPVEASGVGDRPLGRFTKYFSRQVEANSGADITAFAAQLGASNSIFKRDTCFADAMPFDPQLNHIGGEDSLFLKRLVLKGCRFAWAPDAVVLEVVSDARLNWHYVRKRKFVSGQIRVFVNHMVRPIKWQSIGFWMAVGLGQTCIGLVGALATWPFQREAMEEYMVLCYAGLGKLFWIPTFRPHLYGEGHVT